MRVAAVGRQISSALGTRTFRALRIRNYRVYFAGQTISATGLWVQLVAEHWLVLRLGGSGTALGITTALQFTPLLFLGAYAGVLVDRHSEKRQLLIATQTAAGLLALVTAVITLLGVIDIWMIWIAAFMLGCINTIARPAQQAFTMELAGPTFVANAVALNDTVTSSARAIGPAIGGLLIAAFSVELCFLANAVSYAAAVIALAAISETDLYPEATVPRRRGQVREAAGYVWRTPPLRAILLVVLFVSTFFNFQVLLPLLAVTTFQQGAALYGLLTSALGAGWVIGSLIAASWSDPTVRRVSALSLTFGTSQFAVALAPNLPLALVAVLCTGVATGVFFSSAVGCLQINTGEGMRGRVMAFYTIAFLGTAAISGPLVGGVAQYYGPRIGFIPGAVACLLAGALVLLALRNQAAVRSH